MEGSFYTGKYRNFFEEQGYNSEEITSRLEKIFQTIFYGPDDERFYHESGSDMGYMEDTGNHDVRTEGMSYGMMVCVQMNKQKEFDRLWKWVCTYMRIQEGPGKNYFIWSCGTDGTPNADGPAPDGEEFFAMALFFAANRWGDREGIFDYSGEARKILRECIHKGEPGHSIYPVSSRAAEGCGGGAHGVCSLPAAGAACAGRAARGVEPAAVSRQCCGTGAESCVSRLGADALCAVQCGFFRRLLSKCRAGGLELSGLVRRGVCGCGGGGDCHLRGALRAGCAGHQGSGLPVAEAGRSAAWRAALSALACADLPLGGQAF